jgi:hypothetical protein
MKAGDLVRVKDPEYLATSRGNDPKKSRELYPWKFETGIVIDTKPFGSFPGKEVYVNFPSYLMKSILSNHIEVVS